MPLVLSAGAIIIVLAGLLFFLLPEAGNSAENTSAVASAQNPTLNSTNAPSANTAALEPPSGPTPVELARLELQEEQSKALAKEIIRQQVALEDRGVNLWAGDEYAAINNTLDIADDEYRAGAFDKAQGAYQNVKDNLEELSERMPAVLDAQIDAGEAALASGEPESALAAFTIANLLAPDREDLKLNLARAENMEMVLRLTDQAAVLERSQDLAGALALTEEALTLDKQWQPARDARQRLSQAIKQQKFRAAMSRGFRGIAERDYTAARLGFRDAKSILPDSGEPGDGLAQVEQAEKNEQIQRFRAEAEQALAAENWDAAIAVYDKALAVTPTLAFAKDGIAQAKARQALDARLQLFLGDPTELQTDQGLSDAAATLREVTRLQQRSDKLNDQLKTLSLLISNARTQIPISLRSDGKTEVTVRKHAALGRFEAETVYLIPGRYTIVGVRDGYRDVREDIVILPGQSIPAVTIASTEKVRR